MEPFGLPNSPHFDKYQFNGNSMTAGGNWHTWNKPLGKSRIMMMLIGGGGGGGTGVVGANSTAAGGGGGGSGGMTILEMPLDLLPARLYISVGHSKTGAGLASYVSTQPNTTANHVVAIANGGAVGGNAAGATAGAAGGAGGIATAATMPLGWAFAKLALAGQAGIIGGTTVAGAALTLPVTGLRMTGGTGGGGLPAAAATGTNGGSFTVPASPSYFPAQSGGVGSATATNPADNGRNGFAIPEAGFYHYGGTGGASTHGTATGGGLVQSRGGNGGIGCGGGGMGGALTGSTAGVASYGGSGLILFYCY
jgi:hypothetical protein